MTSSALPIILGSSSKWRGKILSKAGYTFTTLNPYIDEKAVTGRTLDPSESALAVANSKTDFLSIQLSDKPPALLICSDQIVSYKGTIREKPGSGSQATEYLKSYKDESSPAETHTAVVVLNTKTGKRVSGVDVARQFFSPIPEDVIKTLVDKGDIFSCAGGFMASQLSEV
jgi:septum formation protein